VTSYVIRWVPDPWEAACEYGLARWVSMHSSLYNKAQTVQHPESRESAWGLSDTSHSLMQYTDSRWRAGSCVVGSPGLGTLQDGRRERKTTTSGDCSQLNYYSCQNVMCCLYIWNAYQRSLNGVNM
jgi:hypothetical protein